MISFMNNNNKKQTQVFECFSVPSSLLCTNDKQKPMTEMDYKKGSFLLPYELILMEIFFGNGSIPARQKGVGLIGRLLLPHSCRIAVGDMRSVYISVLVLLGTVLTIVGSFVSID